MELWFDKRTLCNFAAYLSHENKNILLDAKVLVRGMFPGEIDINQLFS